MRKTRQNKATNNKATNNKATNEIENNANSNANINANNNTKKNTESNTKKNTKSNTKIKYKDEDKAFDITIPIERRIELLQNEIKNKTVSLINPIDGKLRCKTDMTGYRYYHCTDPNDRNGVYLKNSQIQTAKSLAQKEYDIKFTKAAKEELACLEEFLRCYSKFDLNGIYSTMYPGKRQLIHPFLLDDDEYARRWLAVEYPPGYFPDGYEEYYTLKNLRVHSKSEILIAEMLDNYGIPYRYEYPIILDNDEKRPDFTCLNVRTRKEYVWEHFGMMGNIGYATDNVDKITKYIRNGYFPGENAIFTFASGGNAVDSRTVKEMIERYLL